MTGLTSPGSATWGARPAPVLRLVLGGFIYFVICHLHLLSTERRGCRWHRVGRRCRGPRRVGRVQRGGAQARGCHRWDATRGQADARGGRWWDTRRPWRPWAARPTPAQGDEEEGSSDPMAGRAAGLCACRACCRSRSPRRGWSWSAPGAPACPPWTPQGSARQRRVLRARGALSRLFFRSSCFLLNLVFTNKRKQHTTKQATK